MGMTRRDAVTMAAGGVAVLGLSAMAQGKGAPPAKDPKAEPKAAWVINEALLAAALECLKAGETCLDHCVRSLSTGDKSMAECAATVRAMLPMCEAVADLTRLNSTHLKALAAVCAKVCRDCEAACKKHQNHHAECKACMESCQKCAAECEKAAA
ncbi:MAG: four-helix bundle copper-binding protein [Myxococcaceae bacterium]|jgi:Cys-rich four helix bundle protein (predicted Tat secretion target)|nr:four-helix bundle copper-binding protein [Myxococcaceae bacterium]